MQKSSRILGQNYGLTAQEMNFVLKEEGFLEGEPGNYIVTEKGRKYADEQNHHRGTGGYEHYNRYWITRTWDEDIEDELNISEKRKSEIRQAIRLARQKANEPEEEGTTVEYYDDGDNDIGHVNNDELVIAVATFLTAAVTYGIYKATPHIKQWWNDKATPGLKKIRSSITEKQNK